MNIRKITEAANQVSELNDINVTEAVSLKDMGFKKWDYIVPSFRIGRLEGVSADQLTKLFGPPKKGSGDGKSTMEWGFQNRQGLIFTVYDYRNPPSSKSAPHNWSIGGVNKAHGASVQRAFKMMGVPGKMIKEETDPFMVGQTVSEWRDADTGDVMEGVRVMSGAEGMIKNDPAGGASMVSSFRKSKAALSSKPAGSILLLTKEKDPESMTLKIYEPKDFDSLMRGLSKKPEKKVGSKGSWSGGEVTVLGLKEEVEIEENYKDTLKGVRNIKVVKPVDFAKNLTVGSTWTLMYDTSYMGDPMYRLYNANAPSGKKMSGRISGKKIAKALEGGMLVKEGVEVEGEDLQEDKIRYKRILTGVKTLSDSQAPFTVVVISPSDKVIMQKSVKGKNVLPATINTMISSDLKGKSWKAISIEGSRGGYGRTGGVLNVLYPKDVMKESVEEMDEGFAQPTNKQLEKSIKWLEGLLKDPAKMKKSGLDLQDVKDNLRAAKDMIDFGKKHGSKVNKEEVEMDEASWGGGFQSSREAQAGVQASAKADAKRERMVLFSSIRAVMMGKMSKAEFKKKIGQSFEKISPLAKQKAMKQKGIKESVEIDENTYTTHLGSKVTMIPGSGKRSQTAQIKFTEPKKDPKQIAMEIRREAKALGVEVSADNRSIMARKTFKAGDRNEFWRAHAACYKVIRMVKFTKDYNSWGCSGIGLLDCIQKGEVILHASGGGASRILTQIK